MLPAACQAASLLLLLLLLFAHCPLPVAAHCVAYFLPFAFHTHVPRSPCAFWRRPTYSKRKSACHALSLTRTHSSRSLSVWLRVCVPACLPVLSHSYALSALFAQLSALLSRCRRRTGVASARKRICRSLFWSVSSWLSSCLVRLWWSALNPLPLTLSLTRSRTA